MSKWCLSCLLICASYATCWSQCSAVRCCRNANWTGVVLSRSINRLYHLRFENIDGAACKGNWAIIRDVYLRFGGLYYGNFPYWRQDGTRILWQIMIGKTISVDFLIVFQGRRYVDFTNENILVSLFLSNAFLEDTRTVHTDVKMA